MKKPRPSALRMALIAICCLMLFLFFQLNAGCSVEKESIGGDSQQASAAAVEASEATARQNADAANTIQGEVVEIMNSGGYTYILVQSAEKQVWAAGPPTEVKIGETVMLPAGMLMHDFHSKILNRTFETIYFVPSFDAQNAGNGDPHEAINQSHGDIDVLSDRGDSRRGDDKGPISGTRTVADRIVRSELIEKAPGGYTIEEIYTLKTDLAGQTVKVRGVVVKFTPAIMGTNWLHLQDGTGTEESYDLTVTTDAIASFGDLIMIQGVLAVNKDFGAGYRYEVIIEGGEMITD
jgi:hypothetical protein